jgi:hypothetical protein
MVHAPGSLGLILLIRHRFTDLHFRTSSFDGSQFCRGSCGLGNRLIGELLWTHHDDAAFGGKLDKVAEGQTNGFADGLWDAHLMVASEASDGSRFTHPVSVPYNGCRRQI